MDASAADKAIYLLNFALDKIHEAVFLTDPAGRFLYVNEEACRILGYVRDELLGLSVPDIDPDFTWERWPSHWEQLKSRGALLFEARHRSRDGRTFPVEVNANYLEYEGQPYNLALARDISGRKQDEESLRRSNQALFESEQKYRQIFDYVMDGIYLMEVTEDGRFRTVDVNPALERITGIPRAYSVGKTQEEIVPEEVARAVNAKYRRCVEAGGPIEEEVWLDLPTGRHLFHSSLIPTPDENGRVRRIIGISRDITEIKLAEQERLAHLRFLECLDQVNREIQQAENLEQLMTRVLDALLEIFACDRAWLVYPCDPEAAAWQKPMERTRPEYPSVVPSGVELPMFPAVAAKFRDYRAAPGPVQYGPGTGNALSLELEQDHGIRSFIAMAIYPKIGQPWAFGLHQCSHPRTWSTEDARLFWEIGRRLEDGLTSLLAYRNLQASEERYRKLAEELEQRVSERTAELKAANQELEAFAYTVSHDLRAPLRHIDGFMELLQKRNASLLDEMSRHHMEVIAEAARRMGAMIDDLLAFSRVGRHELSKTALDIGQLAQEVIREFEPETSGRDIAWEIGAIPPVFGDRALLKIVLANLISNALKFTAMCPRAVIAIGYRLETDGEIILFVRDNGVGFDMAYVDKLFGVFQRLHREDEFEGTGIGLANVRRIITRHGGRTWAEGRVDQGATLYFSLPYERHENNA